MTRSHAYHLKRSRPYIHSLQNSTTSNVDKVELLKRFPDFVLKDIIEILINIVNKTLPTSSKVKSNIMKNQHSVSKFLDMAKKYKQKPKIILRKQKGEFLPLILPAILSFLNSI